MNKRSIRITGVIPDMLRDKEDSLQAEDLRVSGTEKEAFYDDSGRILPGVDTGIQASRI